MNYNFQTGNGNGKRTLLPGSDILLCILSDEEWQLVKDEAELEDILLDPLRKTFGTSNVNMALDECKLINLEEEDGFGNAAYSAFTVGGNFEDYFSFFGGNSNNGFVKGFGVNNNDDWVVHICGSASCFNEYETVSGAVAGGDRCARNLLSTYGDFASISTSSDCDPF